MPNKNKGAAVKDYLAFAKYAFENWAEQPESVKEMFAEAKANYDARQAKKAEKPVSHTAEIKVKVKKGGKVKVKFDNGDEGIFDIVEIKPRSLIIRIAGNWNITIRYKDVVDTVEPEAAAA